MARLWPSTAGAYQSDAIPASGSNLYGSTYGILFDLAGYWQDEGRGVGGMGTIESVLVIPMVQTLVAGSGLDIADELSYPTPTPTEYGRGFGEIMGGVLPDYGAMETGGDLGDYVDGWALADPTGTLAGGGVRKLRLAY